jgi:hypothetical protein
MVCKSANGIPAKFCIDGHIEGANGEWNRSAAAFNGLAQGDLTIRLWEEGIANCTFGCLSRGLVGRSWQAADLRNTTLPHLALA